MSHNVFAFNDGSSVHTTSFSTWSFLMRLKSQLPEHLLKSGKVNYIC